MMRKVIALAAGIVLLVVAWQAADIKLIITTPVAQLTLAQIGFALASILYVAILLYSAMLLAIAAVTWLQGDTDDAE